MIERKKAPVLEGTGAFFGATLSLLTVNLQTCAIGVVGTVRAILTTSPIWVVDAVWRVLASIASVRVGNTVGIVLVAVEIASELSLAVVQLWAVGAVAIRVIECARGLCRRLWQIWVGSQVAKV